MALRMRLKTKSRSFPGGAAGSSPGRQVLDTLVDSGVARSRSEALAWCVRLVGEHADSWLTQLRDAMGGVDQLRRRGPDLGEAGAGEV